LLSFLHHQEGLNYLESTIGYGVKIDSLEEDGSACTFHCMAFTSLTLTVSKRGGTWIVMASINDEQHIIQRIRMQLKGFLGGKLDYADVFGVHHTTKLPVHEKVYV
jgi:hypothetical protein